LYIDSESTGSSIVHIDSPTNQTAFAINVDNSDALTTGGLMKLESNSSDNSNSRELVQIIQENGSAGSADCLKLHQQGNGLHIKLEGAGQGGIKFNMSTDGNNSNAETLDDYEEGTWTPDFEGANMSNVDYTTGYYTKIGRIVFFSYYAGSFDVASVSGSAVVTGLPFTSSNASNAAYSNFTTLHGTHVDGSSPGGYVNKNDTKMTFVDLASTSGAQWIAGSAKYMMIQGFYYV